MIYSPFNKQGPSIRDGVKRLTCVHKKFSWEGRKQETEHIGEAPGMSIWVELEDRLELARGELG